MLWRLLRAMKYATREPSSAVVNRNQPSSWLMPGCVGGNAGTVEDGAGAGLLAPIVSASARAKPASSTTLYIGLGASGGTADGFGFATSFDSYGWRVPWQW